MVPYSRFLFWSACTIMLILASVSAGCTTQPGPAITPTPTTPASTTQVGTTPAVTTMAVTTPVSSGGSSAITIKNFAFSPATVTIKTGTTVIWTNQDSPAHQIASDSGSPVSFSSSSLSTGASYQFTFTNPGTYPYHCAIHPSMTGTIVVQS